MPRVTPDPGLIFVAVGEDDEFGFGAVERMDGEIPAKGGVMEDSGIDALAEEGEAPIHGVFFGRGGNAEFGWFRGSQGEVRRG
jgi:hypothetical protein